MVCFIDLNYSIFYSHKLTVVVSWSMFLLYLLYFNFQFIHFKLNYEIIEKADLT